MKRKRLIITLGVGAIVSAAPAWFLARYFNVNLAALEGRRFVLSHDYPEFTKFFGVSPLHDGDKSERHVFRFFYVPAFRWACSLSFVIHHDGTATVRYFAFRRYPRSAEADRAITRDLTVEEAERVRVAIGRSGMLTDFLDSWVLSTDGSTWFADWLDAGKMGARVKHYDGDEIEEAVIGVFEVLGWPYERFWSDADLRSFDVREDTQPGVTDDHDDAQRL